MMLEKLRVTASAQDLRNQGNDTRYYRGQPVQPTGAPRAMPAVGVRGLMLVVLVPVVVVVVVVVTVAMSVTSELED